METGDDIYDNPIKVKIRNKVYHVKMGNDDKINVFHSVVNVNIKVFSVTYNLSTLLLIILYMVY